VISPPLAPIDLNAVAGDGFIKLTWGTELGQKPDKFNIRRRKLSEYGYTLIAFTSSKEYIDSSVENNVSYEYVVTAVKQGVESSYSKPVLATPKAKPVLPPSNLKAIFSQGKVKLSWTAPSPTPDYYVVYRKEENEPFFLSIGQSVSTRFEDDSVDENKTYVYRVESALVSGEESIGGKTVTVFVPPLTKCNPVKDNVCDEDCSRLQDPDCVCNNDGNCEKGFENPENCPSDCKEGVLEAKELIDWGLGIGVLVISAMLAVVFFAFKP
jgi:hypothetical protein